MLQKDEIKSPSDWIDYKLATQGREWCAQNYETFRAETGSRASPESYSRMIRNQAAKLRSNIEPRISQDTQDQPASSHDVASLDDALAYHEIDESRFQVKELIHKTWGNENNPNRYTSVKAKPREARDLTPEEYAARFISAVEEYTPRHIEPSYTVTEAGSVLEVSLPDMHFGKRIWQEVTESADFDSEIAAQLYLQAIGELTTGYHEGQFERVLLPVGNDFLNIDGLQYSTTKGTTQETSENPLVAFDIGFSTLIEAINYLVKFGPVHIPIVPGNHDRFTAYLLGTALEAWYRDYDYVKVDNDKSPTKAFGQGNWGIVWHHGDESKPHELAMLFADLYPQLWARTRYREVHQGHLHSNRKGEFRTTDESNGVIVRLLPSLVPADEFHTRHHYRSLREAQALVWSNERGLIGHKYYHP